MEVTSKTITALGTILGNKVDQKDDGKSDTIIVIGPPVVGKPSLLPKVAARGLEEDARTALSEGKTIMFCSPTVEPTLLPKVAASGREEEARTAPSEGKTTKPKSKLS